MGIIGVANKDLKWEQNKAVAAVVAFIKEHAEQVDDINKKIEARHKEEN